MSMIVSMCREKPEYFEPDARKKLYWPAFISPLSECKRDNSKLIKTLNLGKDFGLNISGKQPNWDAIETRIALDLFHAIKFMGRSNQAVTQEEAFKRIPMPPLTRDNYKEWFEEAWALFLSRYGKDYENKNQFSDYWKNTAYRGKRSLIRDAIRRNIKQSFKSISPKSASN